jgi:type I site-specific restriction endonuclease
MQAIRAVLERVAQSEVTGGPARALLSLATGTGKTFLFLCDRDFTHIIIDECHRSAWGKWSSVLTRNANAVQVGLTATPRQIDCHEDTREARADAEVTADNVK